MKKKLLLIILCIAPIILFAQENETEAMAAYMLAEESYASGDYASSLKFLEKAEEKLGNTNSKLLYLKIQIQSELYKNDKLYYDRIMKTISHFQVGPDINNFNQDKVLEVVKMKMAMENKMEEDIRVEQKSKKDKEEREANFRNFGFEGWPFNVDIENLKVNNADSLIFKKKLKSKEYWEDKSLTAFYPSSLTWEGGLPDLLSLIDRKNKVFFILTKNDVVKGYRKAIYVKQHVDKRSAFYTPEKDHQTGVSEIRIIVQDFSKKFGLPREVNNNMSTSYIWESETTKISLTKRVTQWKGKYWDAIAVLEIIQL